MRVSTVVRVINRNVAHELIGVLHDEWRRPVSHPADVRRAAKKISGYVMAAIIIMLGANVILSAPWHSSDLRSPRLNVRSGLHIAVPETLRSFPIEQFVPLP
jgi:hypothetical protein